MAATAFAANPKRFDAKEAGWAERFDDEVTCLNICSKIRLGEDSLLLIDEY
jgi:hypothetical protein